MKKRYFKLFSTCIPVKGSEESHIYDLENETYFSIPNLLLEILEKNTKHNYTISALKATYNHQYDNGIDAFFDEFVKIGVGFFTTEPHLYPKLNQDWFSPKTISNAIIEFSNRSIYDLTDVLKQLENLGCIAVEFRIKDIDNIQLLNILSLFKESRFQSYTFLITYTSRKTMQQCIENFSTLKRLSYIHFFNIPQTEIYSQLERNNLFYTNESLLSYEEKAMLNDTKITVNISIFLEAQSYNVGLNKKIAIDKDGNIKNYLNHETIYGNVLQDNINMIIKTSKIQEKWHLNNDKIYICQSCQYRYVCVDNSDIQQIEGRFVKRKKCGFNPFLNQWKVA